MKYKLAFILLITSLFCSLSQATPNVTDSRANNWFETVKTNASDTDLYQLLYEMPKGGDLHMHLSGAGYAEWWFDLATQKNNHGYQYYTKIKINNCRPYDKQTYANGTSYSLLFYTIGEQRYKTFSACEQAEFKSLAALDKTEKNAWLNSIRLDKASEGRDEFFSKHWQRLGDLNANPYIRAELLYLNLRAFSEEGLLYIEPQVTTEGYFTPAGKRIMPTQVADIFRQRLAEKDVAETGMTWRFQQSILRFLPSAEQDLKKTYAFVASQPEWVAVNMVGREDDDKGHPRRFLETLRQLRHQFSGVKLSIHAGEVDEPNFHVRDTLLLGADRIGHGINLITDDDLMRSMRHGPYLVEINLISNLRLQYVENYSQHPFPEYLRTNIPVALSTDDRGMWDSNMTDEFFVAVKEFNLSWDEVKLLSKNSIQYAFLPESEKKRLLNHYHKNIVQFEKRLKQRGIKGLKRITTRKGIFICQRYKLCN